nr:hypothetical protein [Bacteroidota bacterium]
MKRLTALFVKICVAAILFLISNNLISRENTTNDQFPESGAINLAGFSTDTDCVFPPVWDSVIITASSCILSIAENAHIRINGTSINECDYIGAFYTDENGEMKCGGFTPYLDNMPTGMIIFGDDAYTPEKEGFSSGEEINFKLFSWACAGGKTIDVDNIEFENLTRSGLTYPFPFGKITRMECWTDFDCQVSSSGRDNDASNSNRTFNCDFSPMWDSVINTGYPCFLRIEEDANITINGDHINECDYIGVFYTDENGDMKCGGFTPYFENTMLALIVNGDDVYTPEKEGFSLGEEINFKLFSWSCAGGKTIDVDKIVIEDITRSKLTFPFNLKKVTKIECWTDFDCRISDSDRDINNFNKNRTFYCDFPPTWDSAYYTSINPHLVTINDISSVSVNGINVNECDYIGCFYSDDNGEMKCAGADYFQNNTGIIFPVWADDPDTPEKDGFCFGDTMVFKLFSWPCAGGKTIDVDSIEFDSFYSTTIWYPLGFTVITQINCHTEFDCQIAAPDQSKAIGLLSFRKGWNTFTCAGDLSAVNELHSRIGDYLIVVKEKDGNKVYWPEKDIYTLHELIYGKEYLIYVSKDCEVN